MKSAFQRVLAGFVLILGLLAAQTALAADAKKIDRFLEITGFDVALDSIVIGAEDAPAILGQDPGAFGVIWKKMVLDVMDPAEIRADARTMLEAALDDADLQVALDFYGSDLGQRLVVAENESHLEKSDDQRDEAGDSLLSALEGAGAEGQERLDLFRRMNVAIDPQGLSLRAMQEVQIRFLLAAAAAGVVRLKMDEADMREMFHKQEPELRAAIERTSLAGAAYTYQSFGDAELLVYVEALESPAMRRVYELMNAIQFEITAQRFEMLAARMAGLLPSQEL